VRLVQRQAPSPAYYLVAALGSLLTTVAVTLALLGRPDRAVDALTRVDPGHLLRVFAVVGIIGVSGVISYRAGLWNIGQEGQAIIGALAAIASGSPALALPLSAACALAWTLPAIALRICAGVNEAVTTFLVYIIAVCVARYFVEGPLRDPTKMGFVVTVEAPHIGVWTALAILAALLALVTALYRTRAGLLMKLMASGEGIVRYAGASPSACVLLALGISGTIAGLGGAVEIMTREAGRYLMISQVSAGFGLYGISAAWLGALHPLGAVLSSLYIAWLYHVAVNLKVFGLSSLLSNALVGAAMAWGLLGYVLSKYRVALR
jgi:simple sugar transport system permease protein